MKYTIAFLCALACATSLYTHASAAETPEHFSHAVFDSLLQFHVSGGKVYYEGFDTPAFAAYRHSLAGARPALWSREERIAFWLNAYNASAIAAVLARPGLRVISNADGFFDRDSFALAGVWYTLNGIVDELRAFGEPAVHFGMACGAAGAPRLHNRAYRAATVLKTLRDNARKYLRGEQGAVLDVGANVLMLPALFQQYRSDFERDGKSLSGAVVPYVRETEAAYIAVHRNDLVVRFLPFDWKLAARTNETDRGPTKPYNKPKKTPRKK